MPPALVPENLHRHALGNTAALVVARSRAVKVVRRRPPIPARSHAPRRVVVSDRVPVARGKRRRRYSSVRAPLVRSSGARPANDSRAYGRKVDQSRARLRVGHAQRNSASIRQRNSRIARTADQSRSGMLRTRASRRTPGITVTPATAEMNRMAQALVPSK
jgi:hypothetical protein